MNQRNRVFATNSNFQNMNSVRPNNLSLKYQRYTQTGCKDIGIKQFEFMTKNQLLYKKAPFILNTSLQFLMRFIKVFVFRG